MDKFSYLGGADVAQIDDLYKQFRKDPNSVAESWSKFFEGFDFARTNFNESDSSSATSNNISHSVLVLGFIQYLALYTCPVDRTRIPIFAMFKSFLIID